MSSIPSEFKMQGSAGSADALLLSAVKMNAGCTTHGRLSRAIESDPHGASAVGTLAFADREGPSVEPWQRAEREHESVYTSTHVASASAHPVEEQR